MRSSFLTKYKKVRQLSREGQARKSQFIPDMQHSLAFRWTLFRTCSVCRNMCTLFLSRDWNQINPQITPAEQTLLFYFTTVNLHWTCRHDSVVLYFKTLCLNKGQAHNSRLSVIIIVHTDCLPWICRPCFSHIWHGSFWLATNFIGWVFFVLYRFHFWICQFILLLLKHVSLLQENELEGKKTPSAKPRSWHNTCTQLKGTLQEANCWRPTAAS